MTALRYKTFPEILATMIARARRRRGSDADVLPGSGLRTVLECSAFSDADQYVQMSKLEQLFNIDNCKGDDLDRRALDLGAEIFPELKRRPANTSISSIVVGDGTLLLTARLTLDAVVGDTTFTCDDLSVFPTSGTVTLDQGLSNAETVIYTRVGNVMTYVPVGSTSSLQRGHAAGAVVVRVSVRSVVQTSIAIGGTTVLLTVGTGAAWQTSGTVILERGTVNEEKRSFTRSGDTLTLGLGTTFAHPAGTVVVQGTTGSNRTIASGLVPFVPATDSTKEIDFRTTEAGTLFDGDFVTDLIDVESQNVGFETRAGSSTITRWLAPPFSNATVTNPVAATRGVDREKDDPYRQRLKDFIQSLTRATPLAVTTLVSGATDPATGATVAFAQIIEPVSPGACLLYVTDGTLNFSLGQQPFLGRDVLITDAEPGDRRGRLSQLGPYNVSATGNVTPRLFKSLDRGVSTLVGANFLEDSSKTLTANAYVGYYLKTDDNQFYLITSNTAIRYTVSAGGATPSSGSYSIFNFGATPLIPGTDFTFNEATGDVELAAALVAHDGLVAASDGAAPGLGAYQYSTGLAAYVQRLVNGDATDFVDFPGLRAMGTKCVVTVPNVVTRTFTIKVVAARGFTDAQLKSPVQVAVQTYINSLGIGDNVILSEIIRLVKALPGVDDVAVIDPTSNFIVSSGQLIRISDTDVVII